MSATISRATVVGGHDGRAEIEIELTYDNGGVSTIALDEDACTVSLDAAGVGSIEELVGRAWTVVLPALERRGEQPLRTPSSPPPFPSDSR
ncbi:MAG: hypothetical protein ABJH68_09345 [Ilumatobacter sp.]|uniref:hypothetical protein n=1 Tax=Ilumatobacter sp. TaxID=1967498 RepID=UPI0032988C15